MNRSRLFLLSCLVALAAAPAAQALDITSSGPLTTITISDTLQCQVTHQDDSSGAWFSNGSCGTYLGVNGSNPGLIPSATTPQSLSPDGSTITTVLNTPDGSLEVTEQDSYTAGADHYDTTVTVRNTSAADVTNITLAHGGDCRLAGFDAGYGAFDPATNTISCTRTPNDNPHRVRLDLVPQDLAPSAYYEGPYGTNPVSTGAPFPPSSCACTGDPNAGGAIDNGESLQWSLGTLSPNSTGTVSFQTRIVSAPPAIALPPNASPSDTSAFFSASVEPGGAPTDGHFEYRADNSSTWTSTATQSLGAATETQSPSVTVNGLRGGTTYHVRFVASNSEGTATSPEATFATSAPPGPAPKALSATWEPNGPREIDVAGTVQTFGAVASCTVFFQPLSSGSAGAAAGVPCTSAGNTSRTVTIPVTGLSPATSYHYILYVASANGAGSLSAAGQIFTTPADPAAFQRTVVTANPTTQAVPRAWNGDSSSAASALVGGTGNPQVLKAKDYAGSVADGDETVAEISTAGAVVATDESGAVLPNPNGVVQYRNGQLVAGTPGGNVKRVPVSRHGAVVVGAGNRVLGRAGRAFHVGAGQVAVLDAKGNLIATGNGTIAASGGDVASVKPGKNLVRRGRGLHPAGAGSVSRALHGGVPSGLSVSLDNQLAAGKASESVSVDRNTYARLTGGQVGGLPSQVVVLSGETSWDRPGAKSLDLRPTRRGRSFFKALAKRNARHQSKGQAPEKVKLSVTTKFTPRRGKSLAARRSVHSHGKK